jgi:hypothetical protein
VISTGQVLDEVWPDYPNSCEDLSSSAIADALGRALSPGGWSADLASEAEEVIRGLDWAASSRSLVAELEAVVAR